MHFLQNSWLASHWTWALMLIMLGISMIAYINNRMRLLKKMLAAFTALLLVTLALNLGGIQLGVQTHTTSMMEKLSSDTQDADCPNFLSKVFTFALDILKDKIAD
jgi:hypothetical protein